ncbi:hypothetical protein Nmel_003518, partial [Mimus melanotis]
MKAVFQDRKSLSLQIPTSGSLKDASAAVLERQKKISFSHMKRQPEVEEGKETNLNFSRAGREKPAHPGLGNWENVVSLGSC